MNVNIYRATKIVEEKIIFDSFTTRRIRVTDHYGQTLTFEYTTTHEDAVIYVDQGERNAHTCPV